MKGKRNTRLLEPVGKDRIRRKPLDGAYVAGFIDGEGSFSVSIGKHATLSRGLEVRPEFEIEVRADDREILERILVTVGCGRIYDCSYERYGWYPHVKYKVTSTREMEEILFPFLDNNPLQAKKAESYLLFKEIVLSYRRKEHLTDAGFNNILETRNRLRALGKKAKTFQL
ncbi:MAG: LAGLIDADG family homing endonuclease [Minisyncoccia bacterium]